MSSTALLVVDVQEAALAGCPDADEVVARINELSHRARAAGAAVVVVQHEDADEFARGTPGWRLAAGLERVDGSLLVAKRYRDSFEETGLGELLTRLGVRRLVVTGAHSDYCVQTTALSALVRGYDVVLVSDGHTTVPSQAGDPLSAEAIRAFVNARMATLRYPERTIEVVPAADVVL